ncbi:MAG: hypothetical protein U5K76_15235 [Woeseiaceae bacterium]|nr:hypothetical protein [Woeseiaceae bacterium]
MMRPAVLVLLAVAVVPTVAGLSAAVVLGLDGQALQRVIATPGVGMSIASSVWSGLVATLVSLFLAHLAVALAMAGDWQGRLARLTLPLLAMPHLAVGIGLALVLAPSGLLMRLLSPWATGFELPPDWLTVRDPAGLSLIAGLVIKETCFLILALTAALAQVPATRLLSQARTLGYSPLRGWLLAVAPLLQRRIRLPVAAVAVFGMTNVELAIPLGPDLPPTFSVLLWRWFIDPDPAMHAQAYAGTLVLFAVSLLAIAGIAALGRLAGTLGERSAASGARWTGERPWRRLARAVLLSFWLLGLLAVVAILLRSAAGTWRFPSVLPTGDLLAAWRDVLPIAGGVAGTTLILAVATAIVGVALTLPAAEACHEGPLTRRAVGAWLFLPLLVPQMTFLFGVSVLLARLRIDGTFVAVLWSHLIFALPYLWALLAPARAALDPRYVRVARTLGATPSSAWWRVTAPMLARPTLLAFALAFSVSIALYLPTLFAGAGRIATSATEAAGAAGSGSLRLAAVHAILLALAPLIAFAGAYGAGGVIGRHRQGLSP